MTTDKESVIVVDDDRGVLSALEAELGELYEVTSAASAEQALMALQAKQHAAIVTDVRMPGVDGLHLIGQCAVRYPEMVRVILTAFDDNAVFDAAIGPHGAYKVLKPWGNDLIITLGNALKQRRLNLALRKRLDLKSEILDIDLRLHPRLDEDTLVYEAAIEMTRIPEVVAAAVYGVDETGNPRLKRTVLAKSDGAAPPLMRDVFKPVRTRDEYLHAVSIGDRRRPIAIVALILKSIENDVLHYLDFVGRQAHRALLAAASNADGAGGAGDTAFAGRTDVSIDWLIKELTTPMTVLSSAPYSMTRILDGVRKAHRNDKDFAGTVKEMEELFQDVSKVSGALMSLMNKLRSETAAGNKDLFSEES